MATRTGRYVRNRWGAFDPCSWLAHAHPPNRDLVDFADLSEAAIRGRDRATLRASLDDFKNPWREARELGYDRTSGESFYRNAP